MFSYHTFNCERISKFIDPVYWSSVNLQSVLIDRELNSAIVLELLEVFEPSGESKPKFDDIQSVQFNPTSVGSYFGPSWTTKWFHIRFKIFKQSFLDSLKSRELVFVWDSDSEALAYTTKGDMIQAFTGGDGSDRRDCFAICKSHLVDSLDSYILEFYIEMACNGMFGNGKNGLISPPDPNRQFQLKIATLQYLNIAAKELLSHLSVILDIAKTMNEDELIVTTAVTVGVNVLNTVDINDDSSLEACNSKIKEALFNNNIFHKLPFEVVAVGHCHIDTAWLWDYSETKRKVARSWCTQLLLLEKYKEFNFVASQSVQWEWLEEEYPKLFQRVCEFVSNGKFIPIGGTYVEFDANIPSGESFIRQFLYGLQYFQSKLGVKTDVFWLPDTFGYSGQLPQIMKAFGIKFFLSQKLSWNLFNKFPHSTFDWIGIDGSTILSHFPPADTYNSLANVKDIMNSFKYHKSKSTSRRSLLLYGNGDGGGGANPTHFESIRRLQSCDNFPSIVTNKTPSTFFQEIEADRESFITSEYPKWKGELYLELHQGTLTSQANLKRLNRECETLLKVAEILLSSIILLQLETCFDIKRIKIQLTKLWKKLLLNQFHDVLPGSCIERVKTEATNMLEDVLQSCQQLISNLMDFHRQRFTNLYNESISDDIHLIFNPTCFERNMSVGNIIPNKSLQLKPFEFILLNTTTTNLVSDKLCDGVEFNILQESNQFVLENAKIKATFNSMGDLESLIDKRCDGYHREIIDVSLSSGNHLMLYDDVPFYWDAWDVFQYHLESGRPVNSSAKTSTSCLVSIIADDINIDILDTKIKEFMNVTSFHRVSLVFKYKFGLNQSDMIQSITLFKDSALIKFHCKINWKESHKILKVEFPLTIKSNIVKCDIQFGLIERPTHENLSTDKAMFEFCAHKFIDLSEAEYGVSLLNDSKYGHSCRGSVISISLLRSPKSPDETCDMGIHEFQYGLFPHLTESLNETIKEATFFNCGICETSKTPCVMNNIIGNSQLLSISKCSLLLDSIKVAEDTSNDIILRLFESCGGRGVAKLSTSLNLSKIFIVKMNEELDDNSTEIPMTINPIKESEKVYEIAYFPFKILTLRIIIGKPM